MDIQTKKLQFIEEYLRLTNEEIVEKLANVLRKEKQKLLKAQPMTQEELNNKLTKSEADIDSGRISSQGEVYILLKDAANERNYGYMVYGGIE